jgi:hypothetical protein
MPEARRVAVEVTVLPRIRSARSPVSPASGLLYLTAANGAAGVRYISLLLRLGYNLSYTPLVKTAISIPDEVYEAAEKLADELKMSRSELYARAVSEYVE